MYNMNTYLIEMNLNGEYFSIANYYKLIFLTFLHRAPRIGFEIG